MKTSLTLISVLVLITLLASYGFASPMPGKTVSGKVAAVSDKAIVVDVGSGKSTLDVGAIVQPGTKLMVEGRISPSGTFRRT